ncbi:MAG: relaxase domain-containing protein, partial [Silvibacterium sp.]|nr:relaxase domain-containing protein [Silvibacterium sp.]
MLKISKPLGRQKITEYYKFEYTPADQRYYAEDRRQLVGEWHGSLAATWGLAGGVDPLHYNRMAEGQHPHTGEQLIRHRPLRRDPVWVTDDHAWRQHLEQLFANTLAEGRDCFRIVFHSETGKKWKYESIAHPDRLAEYPVTERVATLLEVHRIAAEMFQQNLAGGIGAGARAYLTSRGVSADISRDFGLGFSDGSGKQLVKELERFGPELMEASGLFVKNKRGEFYDRFRGRLMFPIENAAGDVVAFGARQLSDEDGPKYLNSPASEIYRKGSVLYNRHRAEREAQNTGRIVIVEGYLDALRAYAAGVRDVVALCGTALTHAHAEELKASTRNVVLNLDADEAGHSAAIKNGQVLLEHGLRVRALDLPGDPAEYIALNGAAAYRREINRVRPLIEWLADRARESYDVTTVEGKTDAIHSMIDSLETVQGPDRAAISAEVAEYLEVPETPAEKPKKYLEHIAAWDFTIAPHKSYSVTALVGGDRGIIEDHQEAVRVALDAGEKYTQARMGNTNAPVTTANWAAALFLHDTARPVEGRAPNPHLHTHAVVFNMTEAGDKIRSVQAHEWYRIQSYISAIYHAEMAYRARKRGYELEHGRNFSTRIKGYTDEYLRAVSARTEEIEREKAGKGLIGAEADERVNKRLREAKQSWDQQTLQAEHRREAEEYGNDPDRVVTAARQRQAQQISEEQRWTMAQTAVDYAKQRLYDAQAVVDQYELMRDALRFGLGHLRLVDVERAFEHRLAQQEKEFVRVGHYRENAPGARYTTEEMRRLEIDAIDLVRKRGSSEPIAPHLTRDQFRAEYKQRLSNGRKIVLNNAQMWMAYNVLTTRDQYMIVRGAAGVGKSAAMEPVAEMARRVSGYEVHGIAPTGVAANNLREIGI